MEPNERSKQATAAQTATEKLDALIAATEKGNKIAARATWIPAHIRFALSFAIFLFLYVAGVRGGKGEGGYPWVVGVVVVVGLGLLVFFGARLSLDAFLESSRNCREYGFGEDNTPTR